MAASFILVGADMTISPWGGFTRKYIFLMGLRTKETRNPSMSSFCWFGNVALSYTQ
ncbi:hypothetical protein [Bifidobacterium tsurumiense]|uniref:hypothetical protein n=1 Tax=Bifidobacterium tsurumiense TaxID=356829 RepID=UPI00138AB43C|nr:hypothetical protein [Bifidobacterium tsurumiense]